MVIYTIFSAICKINAITMFNKFFNKQCHSATSILLSLQLLLCSPNGEATNASMQI